MGVREGVRRGKFISKKVRRLKRRREGKEDESKDMIQNPERHDGAKDNEICFKRRGSMKGSAELSHFAR